MHRPDFPAPGAIRLKDQVPTVRRPSRVFVAAIARNGSQGSLGREGIRSALYALYGEKNELGFYGLEAVSAADADRWEEALRKIWAHNGRMGIAQVHRKGPVLVVVWTDGVSPECWEAVNARVVERLAAP